MSYTINVGGKITVTAKGSIKTYAKEDIVFNSQKTISVIGVENGVTFSKPKSAPPLEKITDVVVEFRTKQTGYNGEFGFDWLRIDDGALTTEPSYESILQGGYEAPNGKAPTRDANTKFEAGEAFRALKKIYKQVPIKRVSTTATKYFIPYLNLYPKPISDATIVTTGMPKPPFEAELRMLLDIEGTDPPDQIRLIFDKKYFTIDGKDGTDGNPVLIADNAIGTKREVATTIKITCIDEFDTDQSIKVYSFSKGLLAKPIPQQTFERKIAGKIIVLANKNTPKVGKTPAVGNRKTQKIVLVKVKTNISGLAGGEVVDLFDPIEKINLQNALYQALVFADVKDIDVLGNGILLDLSTDVNFQTGGKYISGTGILKSEPTLNSYMRTLLNTSTANAYTDCFYVFMFGVRDSTGSAGGRVEKIGKKSVVLYKGRDNYTLNHEVLHGLGLLHTHIDGVIDNPNQKFIYIHANIDRNKATDNVMSYQPDGKTTWRWQWKIMRKNIK